MIYSRWRPAQGGYDLYEDNKQVDLGNDMPVPRLVTSSPIGISSVAIGRSPGGATRFIGQSPTPVGTVLPTQRSGGAFGVLDLGAWTPYLPAFLVGGLVGWGVCWLTPWRRSQ